jgi:hypothetical protein
MSDRIMDDLPDVCNNGHELVLMYNNPPAYGPRSRVSCSGCAKNIKCTLTGVWHCESDNYDCQTDYCTVCKPVDLNNSTDSD